MPIQPINFPQLSWEQANPLLTGAQMGEKMTLQPAVDISGINYKNAMAQYLMMPNQALKNLSPLGKTFVEPQVLSQVNAYLQARGMNPITSEQYANMAQPEGNYQNMPTQGQPQGYGQPQGQSGEISNAYQLSRQKLTSDVQARNRNLFATNIEKTINNVDLDALTKYNGPMGRMKLINEQIRDSQGRPSDEYLEYKQAEAKFNFLSGQVRQFYGNSIQPEAMRDLQNKLDPRGAFKSSTTGKASFNSAKDLLEMELETYRQALRTPKAYREQNFGQTVPQSTGSQMGTNMPKNKLGTPTDEDIAFTAKRYKMSTDEVKKLLGL